MDVFYIVISILSILTGIRVFAKDALDYLYRYRTKKNLVFEFESSSDWATFKLIHAKWKLKPLEYWLSGSTRVSPEGFRGNIDTSENEISITRRKEKGFFDEQMQQFLQPSVLPFEGDLELLKKKESFQIILCKGAIGETFFRIKKIGKDGKIKQTRKFKNKLKIETEEGNYCVTYKILEDELPLWMQNPRVNEIIVIECFPR